MTTSLETKLIHAGAENIHGAVQTPIFQSANYLQKPSGSYEDVQYLRMGNSPQHNALHRRLATIESTESAHSFASGMSAISTTLLAHLQSGDHLLMQSPCYGGTMSLMSSLERFGIRYDAFDALVCDDLETKIQDNTKVIYVESMSNPLLGIADLQKIVDVARARKIVSVIDNTFLSPVGFRPIEFGFDIVVHSATKYMNGHSDILAGTVAGSIDHVSPIKSLSGQLGGTLDPHAAFLLERGLKTLAVRIREQSKSAQKIAHFLQAHPRVQGVNYPGLPSHPGHERAAKWFEHFGAVLSFETDVVDAHLRVRIPQHAASLGGVESLIVKPCESTHLGVPPAVRRAAGISDTLLRLAVGLEHTDDLIADLRSALG